MRRGAEPNRHDMLLHRATTLGALARNVTYNERNMFVGGCIRAVFV